MISELQEKTKPENVAQTTQEISKPDFIPEKFWDDNSKNIRVEALAKSYMELEKKLSKSMSIPETDEDKFNLLKMLGHPDTPDSYEVNVEHGMFEVDADLNSRLHTLGFTQEQVQAVYDEAAEKLVPIVLELSAEFQADREVEKLVQEFGGGEKWQEVSRQLLAFGQKNLPEDVLESLSGSYDGVMTLFQMMKGKAPSFGTKNGKIDAMDETSLKSMMKDPKYWRDKDPAFVAKVTEGFEGLYN